MKNVVIVGAGQAGGQAAATLRMKGFEGDITLVGDEPVAPYQRPPLSKKYLAGEMSGEQLQIKPAAFYEKNNVTVICGNAAMRIDREARQVHLADGAALPYDALVLATGSRVRELPVPGADLPGVHYLRSQADVDAIRAGLGADDPVTVIGAGYIGLEVAAKLRQIGHPVSVIELAPRVLARVMAPEVSAFFEGVHRAEGVDLRCGTAVNALHGGDRVSEVECADGTRLPASLVIAGIGILPETALAQAAGLAVDNGIVVDALCRTEDPHIYAAGDCTNHPNELLGRRLRLESVHNANEQAKTAALSIVGQPTPYAQVPWFWSEQYDMRLQTVGLGQGHDQIVIRGDMDARSFAAFYLKDGELIAVDAVGRPQEFMGCKTLIAARASIDADTLRDDSTPFKDIVKAWQASQSD